MVAVLGAGTALAGSWVVVEAVGEVPGWEARAFELVNDLPGTLWPVVWPPMQLGSMAGSLAAVSGTYAVSRDRRLTLATLAASQTAYWTANLVKAVVSRARPGALLLDVRVREHVSGLGYVSGHTAVATALATALAPSVPRPWRVVAFGLATLVGLARIYAGAHLPLDVIGGAGLGVLAGTLARWAFGLGGAGLPPSDEISALEDVESDPAREDR
jgi:undecaprenyl-diphosphatase